MAVKAKYRVEIRYPRQGWFLIYPDACGLTLTQARSAARVQMEHELYYAALGARIDRVRIVREGDNAVVE